MPEEGMVAWQTYVKAEQQFDYFVTAGAGTALSYAVQSYDASPVDRYVELVPVSWALLLLTVAAGIGHLSLTVRLLDFNRHQLELSEAAQRLRTASFGGTGVFVHGANVALPPKRLPEAIAAYDAQIADVKKRIISRDRLRRWVGYIRTAGLILGLAALALWKSLNLWSA